VGAAVAWALAERRAGRVTLLERNTLASGASGKSGALVRVHYTNPHDSRLALLSLELWRGWSERVGGPSPFSEVGFAQVVGPELVDALVRNTERLREQGADTRVISPEELRAIDPAAAVDDVGAAAYEPHSGYCDAPAAVRGFARRARQLGAVVAEGVEVQALLASGDRVSGVQTNVGVIATRAVVNAAGAWSAGLLRPLGIDLPVRPKPIMTHFLAWPDDGPQRHLVYIDAILGTYFRPDDGRYTLVGAPWPKRDIDPDQEPFTVDADATAAARATVARRLPFLQRARPSGGRHAYDGYSDDWHAILDRDAGLEGLYLATGMSGTGFKVAPAVGMAVADLVTHGAGRGLDLRPFRLARFAENDPIRSEVDYGTLSQVGLRLT
jgi:sarcosine oxidase subunit beta